MSALRQQNLTIDSAHRSSLKCIECLKCTEYGEKMGWPLKRRTKQLNVAAEVGLKLICYKLDKKDSLYIVQREPMGQTATLAHIFQ